MKKLEIRLRRLMRRKTPRHIAVIECNIGDDIQAAEAAARARGDLAPGYGCVIRYRSPPLDVWEAQAQATQARLIAMHEGRAADAAAALIDSARR